jgi:spore coat polysaccharide biosynthesis predicted glycosyltransferase SpsG
LKKVLFLLSASSKIGLGHFYRCSVFSTKLQKKKIKTILLNTENSEKLKIFNKSFSEYINFNLKKKNNFLKEFLRIHKIINPDYVIIDTPIINSDVRKKLRDKNILWLEFANGKKNLKLPAQVINTIPYSKKTLSNTSKKKNYYGHEFSFLRKEFFKKINFNKKRIERKKIFLCFGGGDDRGLYKFIINIMFNFQSLIKEINILCSDYNVNKKLRSLNNNFNKSNKNFFNIYYNQSNFVNLIDNSNLIFVTGGGITHEINVRMKKMNIISITNNQILQSKRWEKFGHNYLGEFNKKNEPYLRNKIIKILKQTNKVYIKRNIFKDSTNIIINDTIKIIK